MEWLTLRIRYSRFRPLFVLPLFLNNLPAYAGVIFAAPPTSPPAQDHYPESRFGALPARPNSHTAEEEEGHPGREKRSPAGLVFEDRAAEPSAKAVISDSEMPKSPSNVNPKPDSSSRTGVQEVALIAGDLGFFPKTVFVTRDIPVRMFVTGASKKPLCLMMDSFHIRKQVRAQKVEEISFTPNHPGQYRFYCPVNGMEGTLFVKDITTIMSLGSQSEAEGATAAAEGQQAPSPGTEVKP